MNKSKMSYFSDKDILHFVISDEEEAKSIELSSNITAELNEKGELIGIEILNASAFVRDFILEGVQAKVLKLVAAGEMRPRARGTEGEEEGEPVVIQRAGRYTSEDVHRALFEEAPEPRTLEALKEGIGST